MIFITFCLLNFFVLLVLLAMLIETSRSTLSFLFDLYFLSFLTITAQRNDFPCQLLWFFKTSWFSPCIVGGKEGGSLKASCLEEKKTLMIFLPLNILLLNISHIQIVNWSDHLANEFGKWSFVDVVFIIKVMRPLHCSQKRVNADLNLFLNNKFFETFLTAFCTKIILNADIGYLPI